MPRPLFASTPVAVIHQALGFLALLPLGASDLAAAPTDDNEPNLRTVAESRRWFEDSRFGISVHWGPHSLLGKGETVMLRDGLPASEYEKLPPRFNPSRLDADEWVKTARAAGARYLCVTAKGPDGFCLFDSRLTAFDIVDASPYGRDPLKALAAACRKQGVKLFLRYSLLDWHHPDYVPRGQTATQPARAEGDEWSRYVAYARGQVREICSNYGEIAGLTFEGCRDRPEAEWELAEMIRVIRELQPAALITSDFDGQEAAGEDIRSLESRPTDKTGDRSVPPGVLSEHRFSINDSWGYRARDTRFKDAGTLIHALVDAAGQGANLLLGIAPRPDGSFDPQVHDRLMAVGKWLETHGESIYHTQRGPTGPRPWGTSTLSDSNPKAVFLHVTKPVDRLTLPAGFRAFAAVPLGKSDPMRIIAGEDGVTLPLPETVREPIDTIIILKPIGANPLQ